MNVAILATIGKWVSCLLIGFVSIFSGTIIKKELLETTNINEDKSYSALNETIPYETKIVYNSKTPSTIKKILVPGEVGISTIKENDEKVIVKEPVTEIIEQGTGAAGEYVGRITGYGPDCPGCSSTGTVACHTENRGKHSLITDGIYYEDKEYGKVRILSAASAFPCGTIIKVDNGKIEPFYGVVLDRGGSMNSVWKNGTVWIDLAYASSADARAGGITGRNIKFSVQRWGF